MKLVIVESPTKAKTISRFLGKDPASPAKRGEFVIESSYGHVRDLPKSQLGVDVENNFTPKYIIPIKARKNVSALKQKAAEAEKIILATDEDREGEAIAWHLLSALGLEDRPKDNIERIVFHEITERAIKEALKNPRDLDMHLVDAQQARRILDRLVGYKLSPFLWKKIRSGLSAGRVQSVAVRLIAEREAEIEAFRKEEYWTIEGEFSKSGEKFSAQLYKILVSEAGGKKALDRFDILEKFSIKTEAEAKKILDKLEGKNAEVLSVEKSAEERHAPPPFTTSTLQQAAFQRLRVSAKETMRNAQRLYEEGLITYMRTDSLNLSQESLVGASGWIKENLGGKYLLPKPRTFKTKSKSAQEAHEAIRPTDPHLAPGNRKQPADPREAKLYELIWRRFMASQLPGAVLENTKADIGAGEYVFRANGARLAFDGFLKIYQIKFSENILPELKEKDDLGTESIVPIQHFTEPPPRYNEASLVKTLEKNGIGRPSTYAPTIATIQDRGYVEKDEQRRLRPTETGKIVNGILVEHFPEIVNIGFTAKMEEEFDEIAEGKIGWVPVIQEFYAPFSKNLKEKMASVEQLTEESSTPCPHCGKMMLIKFGRLGKFLACPDPESKVTLPLPEEAAKIKQLQEKTTGELCPICGKPLEVKRGRFGYFLGCVDYPKCKGIMKIYNKTGFKCPACLASPDPAKRDNPGDIVEKKSRGRGRVFYACSRFPDCAFLMGKKPESQVELDEALAEWRLKPPKNRKGANKEKNLG